MLFFFFIVALRREKEPPGADVKPRDLLYSDMLMEGDLILQVQNLKCYMRI